MFVWEGGIFILAFLVCVFLLLLIFTLHRFHAEIINQMPKWPWLPKTHRILLVPAIWAMSQVHPSQAFLVDFLKRSLRSCHFSA